MRTLLVSISALSLALMACGGSDGGGDSSDQGATADLFIEVAAEEGLTLDEDCVREAANRFSDADAAALVAAGRDGNPELSEEGDAIADGIFACVDAESYLDNIVRGFAEEDDSIDGECLRSELAGLTAEEMDEKLFDAAFTCSTDGE